MKFMVQLTPEQERDLEKEEPPRVVARGQEYVLIRSEVYQRMYSVFKWKDGQWELPPPAGSSNAIEPEEIDPSLYEAEDLG